MKVMAISLLEHTCHKDVATDSRALWARIRKASRARTPDSPMSSEGMEPEQLDQRRSLGAGTPRWSPGKELSTVAIFERNLPQDVATDGIRKASRARAPDSPMPGEGRVSRVPGNAGTGKYRPYRSRAGSGASRTNSPADEEC